MLPTVYIETSVISYLTADLSRDLLVVAHQQVTIEWWANVLARVQPVVSAFVIDEAANGSPGLAARRLRSIESFKILDLNGEIEILAEKYFEALNIPERSRIDASHLATAAWHGVDYLLSWNCKHIASARVQRILQTVNQDLGIKTPIVCTPEALMEV